MDFKCDPDVVKKSLELQREEMAKHKWFLSEKAQKDLGNLAVVDWVEKYSEHWRDKYNGDLEEEIEIIKRFLESSKIPVDDDNVKYQLILWLRHYHGPTYTE